MKMKIGVFEFKCPGGEGNFSRSFAEGIIRVLFVEFCSELDIKESMLMVSLKNIAI